MTNPLLYMEHLSDSDIDVLARVAGTRSSLLKQRMHERPEVIDEVLASRRLYDEVFDPSHDLFDPRVSTFLAFAVVVNRSASDLQHTSYVPEWSGPGKRLPVFDVEPLREFISDGERRYFLIEFLNSFTTVASGSYVIRTRNGYKRRRFSELDPVRLSELVDQLPPTERAGGYRRLGDVALVLSGVFPDHVASHPLEPAQRERLSRSAAITSAEALGSAGEIDFMEAAGAGWYRRAVDAAAATVGAGPEILRSVAERFTQARRILNYVSDRFLYGSEQGLMRPTG
jgi:hypothetical protein